MKNSLFVVLFSLCLVIFAAMDIKGYRAQPRDAVHKTALSISGLTVLLFVLWLMDIKIGMPTRPFIDPIGMAVYNWIKEVIA
ncbi:hypothetical protein [Gorillibacterium sp. sgz500922]|uniref:hypothetical protein n=1 Tax=Gorillibacterium sp. sgz500922 TaxID=3446694 RepID=UPI003F670DD6